MITPSLAIYRLKTSRRSSISSVNGLRVVKTVRAACRSKSNTPTQKRLVASSTKRSWRKKYVTQGFIEHSCEIIVFLSFFQLAEVKKNIKKQSTSQQQNFDGDQDGEFLMGPEKNLNMKEKRQRPKPGTSKGTWFKTFNN